MSSHTKMLQDRTSRTYRRTLSIEEMSGSGLASPPINSPNGYTRIDPGLTDPVTDASPTPLFMLRDVATEAGVRERPRARRTRG
jgi:hypothetical protein